MRTLFWSLFLFVIWLALTMSLGIQEVVTGLVVSVIVALLYTKNFQGDENFRIKPLIYLKYLGVFLKELVLANIDVAKRVIDPKLPINPGIVAIKTNLKEDYKKLILANSITLTPGTITMDVQGDTLYIHWIDATTNDIQKASKEIAGSFEEVLLKL